MFLSGAALVNGNYIEGRRCLYYFNHFFSSVSSALLPHAAAEKESASRGSHRGKGRLATSCLRLSQPASTSYQRPPISPESHLLHHRPLHSFAGRWDRKMLTASVSERKTPYIQHKKKKIEKKEMTLPWAFIHIVCFFLGLIPV